MRKAYCLLFAVFAVMFNNCSFKPEQRTRPSKSELVLTELLGPVIDSLSKVYNLDHHILTHLEFFPDEVKKNGYLNLKDYLRQNSVDAQDSRLELLNKLAASANDSLEMSTKTLLIGTTRLHFFEVDSLLKKTEFFGTFSVSNVVFDDSQSNGAFYFAMNCGNDCSRGFVFFIKNERNGVWTIKSFYQVWG